MYVYGLWLLFDFATKNLHFATIFLPLSRQMRLKDFVNFEPCTNNNPKPFWSFVKSMRKGSNNLVSLNVDGVILSNDFSIVESMNEFFSSVFTSEDCDNFPEFEYVTNSKLSNILCDTKEVEKLLKNLNIYKSPGPDSLPPRILKECASVLSSPLCFFFNKSFSTGKLPHLWKLANITPLFKKGSKTDGNNYRQISLTSVVCKIAEKIVKSRVMDFW